MCLPAETGAVSDDEDVRDVEGKKLREELRALLVEKAAIREEINRLLKRGKKRTVDE